jgi:hypothetical protein
MALVHTSVPAQFQHHLSYPPSLLPQLCTIRDGSIAVSRRFSPHLEYPVTNEKMLKISMGKH